MSAPSRFHFPELKRLREGLLAFREAPFVEQALLSASSTAAPRFAQSDRRNYECTLIAERFCKLEALLERGVRSFRRPCAGCARG